MPYTHAGTHVVLRSERPTDYHRLAEITAEAHRGEMEVAYDVV